MVILSLKSDNPSFEISAPSILILPPHPSMILQSARQSVDFPAPVHPTTPIFSPGFIFKLSPQRTSSVSSRYLAQKFSNSISPLVPI